MRIEMLQEFLPEIRKTQKLIQQGDFKELLQYFMKMYRNRIPATEDFYDNNFIRYYRAMDLLYQKMILERWERQGKSGDVSSLNEEEIQKIRKEIDDIVAFVKSDKFNYLGQNYNGHVIEGPIRWLEEQLVRD